MIALLVSACLVTDVNSCRTFRVPLPEETDPRACTLTAMPYLPIWAQEHPGWEIRKWSCATADVANI